MASATLSLKRFWDLLGIEGKVENGCKGEQEI